MNAMTKVADSKAAVWAEFQKEIKEREQSIVSMLPQHVGKQRFISSAIAAVKQNPDLLSATARSLMTAITKSAQDGLLPDGREGVITIYREKQKDNSYRNVAQWNPMIYGLRKRARELDGIIINAQVVHEHDHFEREEGDDPKIVHQPAPLGQTRGRMVGAYAIFRNADGILHREVMEAEQIETVRAQSRAPDGLMWKKFTEEAWRKTVVRRGIKSVPVSEGLEQIVRRDDEMFDFSGGNGGKPKPETITPPADGERRPLPPLIGHAQETADDGETIADQPDAAEAETPLRDKLLGEINADNLPTVVACAEWAAAVADKYGDLPLEDAQAVNKALLAHQSTLLKKRDPAKRKAAAELSPLDAS